MGGNSSRLAANFGRTIGDEHVRPVSLRCPQGDEAPGKIPPRDRIEAFADRYKGAKTFAEYVEMQQGQGQRDTNYPFIK